MDHLDDAVVSYMSYDECTDLLWIVDNPHGRLFSYHMSTSVVESRNIPLSEGDRLGPISADGCGNVYVSVNGRDEILGFDGDFNEIFRCKLGGVISMSADSAISDVQLEKPRVQIWLSRLMPGLILNFSPTGSEHH